MGDEEEFYDEKEGYFKINPEINVAHLLGEDVDKPRETFRKVENICDRRINQLSKVMYMLRKESELQKEETGQLDNLVEKEFDEMENDLYYRIKNLFGDFERKNEELIAQNLMLQKYLTQLTKEKMDLLVQINVCMNKLDNIENYMGINLAQKRKRGKK